MKKIILLMLLVIGMMISPASVKAQGLITKISGPHFKAGESVVITDDLVGDVYVAGATVMIEGDIDGDLLVGGGTVTLNGEVTEDLRVGGGNVILNGVVGQDITAGGGTITFGPSSEVGGSVLAAGGMVVYNGEVAGNVWTGAGNVQLAGDFGQDVKLEAGSLQLLANSMINGNLMANYQEEIDISDQAQVIGEQEINQVQRAHGPKEAKQIKADFTEMKKVAWGFRLALGLVTGLVLMYLFPQVSDAVSTIVAKKPWPSLGWGLLKLVAGPLVIILMLVTIIGMPLGFLALTNFTVSWMLATLVAGKAVGEKIYQESKAKWLKNNYLQFTLGLVILNVVCLVPVVGWLVRAMAFLIGFGAIGLWLKGQIKPKKK